MDEKALNKADSKD